MSIVDDLAKGLGTRAGNKRVSTQLANIEYQLDRIASALEVFSRAAEHDLTEAADKNIRRRTSKLTIGALDTNAANTAYHEAAEAQGVVPPPDNENTTGPF